MTLSRRRFLFAGAAVAAWPRVALLEPAAPRGNPIECLIPGPARADLLGGKTATGVWANNGTVPGPALELEVGQRLRTVLDNRLPRPTTVHWHGMPVPNGMDGVPALTQPPVAPGGTFHYDFAVKNPGTFWYHPHFQSAEQLDRGPHGVIVVADETPVEVDRDLVWMLDDWRLDGQGQIVDDFDDLHDSSHQGRIGNTATLNGRVPHEFPLSKGERIRLRLVNVANAWIFGLDFKGHSPRVIAYDGHAVAPHSPEDGVVVVGPAQRVDVILDATGDPRQRFEVVDRYYRDQPFKLLDLVYSDTPVRSAAPSAPAALPAPDLPEPDLDGAERHQIRFTGGAMGGMHSARIRGEDTAFPHPVHLHGHPMKVLINAGEKPARVTWRDTLLMAPRTRTTVALVADNPGKWMLHCHIPEHQEAGMTAVASVT